MKKEYLWAWMAIFGVGVYLEILGIPDFYWFYWLGAILILEVVALKREGTGDLGSEVVFMWAKGGPARALSSAFLAIWIAEKVYLVTGSIPLTGMIGSWLIIHWPLMGTKG